jgi:F0F1-type ATP synthase assembly protein I
MVVINDKRKKTNKKSLKRKKSKKTLSRKNKVSNKKYNRKTHSKSKMSKKVKGGYLGGVNDGWRINSNSVSSLWGETGNYAAGINAFTLPYDNNPVTSAGFYTSGL